MLFVIMLLDQREALAQRRQHAERQHVDLVDLERVEVVFVPFDDGAFCHRGVLDGHQFVERSFGQHEPADMLREVAREADQGRRQFEGQGQSRIVGIEAGLLDMPAG